MAPNKTQINVQSKLSTGVSTRHGIITRSQNAITSNITKQSNLLKETRSKRKAEASPLKDKIAKRSALGNITNALLKKKAESGEILGKKIIPGHVVPKVIAGKKVITSSQTTRSTIQTKIPEKVNAKTETSTKLKPILRTKQQNKKEEEKAEIPSKLNNVRRSVDLEKSDESSLYVSALEEVPEENTKRFSKNYKESEKTELKSQSAEKTKDKAAPVTEKIPVERRYIDPPKSVLPTGVQWDFDSENWQDPCQVPQYAMDIFIYLKERESLFPVNDYMEKQVCLTRWMRSLLVDWMVAVQESFELNHETLYLAVKLVDLYLSRVVVGKENLQLLGATSLFIASKFDERIPPMTEDFLYICDGAYNHRELIRMEINILKVMDFDLGIPLSYRFLRRYARCAKVSMPTLTLARYILEYSLMDYMTISLSDSKMAAAALFLALQMKDLGGWTKTLEYYTGYKLSDFTDVVKILNEGLHKKQKEALATVRNKYSHKIFFEVAKVPLKENLDI